MKTMAQQKMTRARNVEMASGQGSATTWEREKKGRVRERMASVREEHVGREMERNSLDKQGGECGLFKGATYHVGYHRQERKRGGGQEVTKPWTYL